MDVFSRRGFAVALWLAGCAAIALPAQAQDADSGTAAAAQPFDFRGFRLGMSLAEFKRTPAPVAALGSPRAACARLIDPDDASRSVVRCIWLQTLADGRRVQARIMLGEVPARTYSFVFFAAPGRHEMQLQQITLTLPGKGRARVFKRLSEKFGQPAQTAVDDNQWWAQWQNASGRIALSSTVADGSTIVTFKLGRP
jgi:hypothetical protein